MTPWWTLNVPWACWSVKDEERTMELQSDEVVHEPPRPCEKRRRLGRGLMMVVTALGLIAVGALGATLAPRYLGWAPPALVATAPTPPVSALFASEPHAASAPAGTAEVVLSPEAVSRAAIKTPRADA